MLVFLVHCSKDNDIHPSDLNNMKRIREDMNRKQRLNDQPQLRKRNTNRLQRINANLHRGNTQQQNSNINKNQQLVNNQNSNTKNSERSTTVYTKKAIIISGTVSNSESTRPWIKNVQSNHQAFCSKNNYEYIHHHSSGENKNINPPWLKIVWLKNSITTTINATTTTISTTSQSQAQGINSNAEFIVWIDDDIVITNMANFLNDYFTKMNDKHLLVVKDAGNLNTVNTGIMIFRNTEIAYKILNKIWALRNHIISGRSYTLSNCPNNECLYEQDALNILLSNPSVHPIISKYTLIVLPRSVSDNLNTFLRISHYDSSRRINLNYDNDDTAYKWKKGDNTCHCTGMTTNLKHYYIKHCLENVAL